MWIYIPVLYFKQLKEAVLFQEMAKLKENEFLEFVRNYLNYRHTLQCSADATSITNFKLDMRYDAGPDEEKIR